MPNHNNIIKGGNFMAIEPIKKIYGDVLIIDDEVDFCEIIKANCEKMGCFRNIIFAHDGSIASNKLQKQKFALIILDLKMPKKGGVDLLKEMHEKSLNSKNSVAIISGGLDRDLIEQIASTGVRTFIPKPFPDNVFQEKILKLLNVK